MRSSRFHAPAPCAFAAVVALAVTAAALRAQDAPTGSPQAISEYIWIALGLGGGRLERWSDQEPRTGATTVAGSFRFGVILTPALRVGLEANGWELDTSNLNDPAKGRTVNELLIVGQWYPWPRRGLYLKGGYGWGSYSTNAQGDWGSSAFGAVALGAGCELRLWRSVSVTVSADWARGPLGSVTNTEQTSTARRFRGWNLVLGAQWH